MPDYNAVKPTDKKPEDKPTAVNTIKSWKEATAEKPKLKAVGTVTKRKRNVLERLVVGLIGPDGLPAIGHYLGSEVVMPAVKDIIANSLTTGIQMAIFGKDSATRPNTTNYQQTSRAAYSQRTYRPTTNYSNPQPTIKQRNGQDRASNFNSEDYIMDDRTEAMKALSSIQEYADEYNQVSLADFFDVMGVDTQYTDNNYGWLYDDIMKGKVVMIRGGYALRLPRLDVLS